MKKIHVALLVLFTGVLASCVSVPLEHGAQNVVVTTSDVPDSCQDLGRIAINQQNDHTTLLSRDADFQQMALNSVRNQALGLGANAVEITSHHVDEIPVNIMETSPNQARVIIYTLAGTAYHCNFQDLSHVIPATNNAIFGSNS